MPVVVWINEYFGRPVRNGKSFEESNAYRPTRAGSMPW
ncbi:hypothetical protein PHAMO_380010 [Magnetospirillum molischianum DSM 120]|uniref:Uncharacterized protein n=1 Tax=Magnetospirillum molischianum DSM 120 TaxID=1150626 RepID=H8FVF4_MAGML|nr:hypothetical protein PHAMO_380010 [Magnetospirillum molischianum DSM 120]